MPKRLLVVLFFFLFLTIGCVPIISFSSSEPRSSSPSPSPTVKHTVRPTSTPNPSKWNTDYIVDNFGDRINILFAYGSFSGSFSNTATTNSALTVQVFYYTKTKYIEESIKFRLLEYDKIKAYFTSGAELRFLYRIDGKTYRNAIEYDGSDYLVLSPSNRDHSTWGSLDDNQVKERFEDFVNALSEGKIIQCYIEDSKYGSKYHFDIDGTGFNEAKTKIEKHYSSKK